MQDWWQHIVNPPASFLASVFGAVIGVALEFRRHTLITGILAIVSGVGVAWFGTDAIVSILSLPPNASNAVAAVLGISGRNLISWWLSASKDPISIWDRLRGKGGGK
jgi:hypothetical protein